MGYFFPVPMSFSNSWLHLLCGTLGFTFAQKPYSLGAIVSQKDFFLSFKNSIFTIDFIDLKPYFQGNTNLIGAPFQIIIGKNSDDDILEFKEVGKEIKKIKLPEIIKIIKKEKEKNWFLH